MARPARSAPALGARPTGLIAASGRYKNRAVSSSRRWYHSSSVIA